MSLRKSMLTLILVTISINAYAQQNTDISIDYMGSFNILHWNNFIGEVPEELGFINIDDTEQAEQLRPLILAHLVSYAKIKNGDGFCVTIKINGAVAFIAMCYFYNGDKQDIRIYYKEN